MRKNFLLLLWLTLLPLAGWAQTVLWSSGTPDIKYGDALTGLGAQVTVVSAADDNTCTNMGEGTTTPTGSVNQFHWKIYKGSTAQDASSTLDVGTYTLRLYIRHQNGGGWTPSYASTTKDLSFEIKKGEVTVTGYDITKVWDDPFVDPTIGDFNTNASWRSVSGLPGTDAEKWDAVKNYIDFKRVDNGTDVGSYGYTFQPKGSAPTNFDLHFVGGNLNITQATNVAGTVSITDWTYGDAANDPSISGFKYGEETVEYLYSTSSTGPWDTYANVVNDQAGDYYVQATIPETINYTEVSAVTSFTIDKRNIDPATDFTVTAADPANLVYTGHPLNLLSGFAWTSGVTRATEVWFSVDETNWYSLDDLKYEDVADFPIYVKMTGDANHNDLASTKIIDNVSITPADLTPVAAADANDVAEGLVYTGANLKLLKGEFPLPEFNNVGRAGTFEYFIDGVSVGNDWNDVVGLNADVDADAYELTYTFVPTSANFNPITTPQSIGNANIAKAEWKTFTDPTLAAASTYDATDHKLITAAAKAVGVIPADEATDFVYIFDGNEYTDFNDVTAKFADETGYKVSYKALATSNYNESAVKEAAGVAIIKRAKLHVGAQGLNIEYGSTPAPTYLDLIKFDEGEIPGGETATVDQLKDALVTFTSIEGGTKENLPTDAGEYDFVLAANDADAAGEAGSNYELVDFIPNGTLTITKIDAVPATIAAATPTYDGTDQELITVDDSTLDGGDMLYFLDEEGAGAPPAGDARWTADIPTGKNAGDYTVWYYVKGDKNHNDTDPAVQVDITIARKALADAMFTFSDDDMTAVYTGADLMPTFTAADGDPSILAETDFTVAKTNSDGDDVTEMVNVGVYTFTFDADAVTDGNYTGTITADFEITQKDLADAMFTLSEDVTYSGAAQQPTITAVDGDPNALAEADYTIEVKDSEGNVVAIDALVDADTYTFNFIAAAGGNYSGSASAEWTIGQKELDITMFTLSSYEEVYDGNDLMPTYEFADGEPSALVAADFTVATTNSKPEAVTEMIDADTYTFTFTAAADGNYTGEVSADFVIKQDEAEFVVAEANNLTYNGKDQALVTEAETDAVDGVVEYQVLQGEEVLVDWTEDYSAIVQRNAGDYTVKTKFTASEINYSNPEVEKTVDVTINKATIGYTLSNLEKTWNGEPFDADEIATLFTLTAGGDGTKLFGDDEYDKPFTLSLPEDYRDAGTYTFKQPKVEFKTIEGGYEKDYPVNYNVNFTGEAEVVINKADIKAEDYTAPAAIAGVTYTGEDQDIVTEGEVTTTYQYPEMEEALPIGKMVYATTEDATEWSEHAPKGNEAGGYTVYFKIEGDDNHNDSDPIQIEDVEIIQALLTEDFLPEEYETELPYKGAAYEAKDFIPALVGITEAEGYEVYASEMKDADDYVITFQGINNYQGQFEVPVKVAPIDVIAVAPKGIKKVYDGTASLEGVVKNDDITFVGVLSGEHITVPEDLALSTEGIAVSDKPYAITVDAAAINAIAANNNYNILEETIDGTLTITKAPAFKVGFDAVPTSAWTKKFGEDDPELTGYTVAVTDGEFFDDIADVLAATTAERAEGEDVDTYDVTLTIDATADVFANYEGVEFDGTAAEFTITKSDKVYTVSLANRTETYKAAEFETALTIAPEDLVIAGYDGELTDFFTTLPTATLAAGAKTVGDYNITLKDGESQNFNFTFVPATFTIEPFNVTVATIDNQTVVQGKELDVTAFTITAPEADADLFYVTAPGLVDMNDIVTGDAGVYEDGLVLAVDASVADNYTGLDAFTADLEIIGISGDAVVLADNEDCKPEAQDGVDVTFASRKINAGNWNVVALPFAATVTQISDAFGYAAVDVLTEENANAKEIHFHIISSGTIPAYTPFIVKTTEDDGYKKENFDQVVFHNVNIEAGDGENKSVQDLAGNKFWGTFQAETKIWGEKFRYMSKGAWYDAKNYTESNPAKIGAFRGYIEMVEAGARIFIEEPDGTVTAIDAVEFNKQAAEGMYNLNGVKVNNLNRKGVYIKNGVKVIK